MANQKVSIPNNDVLSVAMAFNMIGPQTPDAPRFPGAIQLKLARIGKPVRVEAEQIGESLNGVLEKCALRTDPNDPTSPVVRIMGSDNKPIPNSVKVQPEMFAQYVAECDEIRKGKTEFDVELLTSADIAKIELPEWALEQLLPFIANDA